MVKNIQKSKIFSKRELFNLIWPLLVEQLLTVLVGMVDVLMVAVIGEAAVSGVSLVDAVNNLVIQVLFALTAGGTVVCAQYIGADDQRKAGKTTAQLLVMTLFLTICVMLFFLAGGNGLLRLLFGRVESDVLKDAGIYLRITALSFPFLAMYHTVASAFRAEGNTRIAMLFSLFMNGVNIAGNAVCIFGLKMGVEGVAIPTLLARISGAVGMLIMLEKGGCKARIQDMQECRPNRMLMIRILRIGVPNGVESSVFQLGKLILQSLVSTLGTASIAGFAVASNLVTYLYLPGNALGAATLTIAGQCYGAGERKQAKQYMKTLLSLNYILLAVICTIMFVGKTQFISAYHLTGEAARLAEGLLVAHTIAMVIWPIGFLLPYYFRAIGKAAFTMIVALLTMWICRIGLAYVFVKILHMSVLGVWYAMFIDWFVRFVIYVVAFSHEGKD